MYEKKEKYTIHIQNNLNLVIPVIPIDKNKIIITQVTIPTDTETIKANRK